MNQERKKILLTIKEGLEKKGVNFNLSPFQVSDIAPLEEAARMVGYKRSKSAYFGTGRSFYEYLQRLHD